MDERRDLPRLLPKHVNTARFLEMSQQRAQDTAGDAFTSDDCEGRDKLILSQSRHNRLESFDKATSLSVGESAVRVTIQSQSYVAWSKARVEHPLR
jgi:hypothetical protein